MTEFKHTSWEARHAHGSVWDVISTKERNFVMEYLIINLIILLANIATVALNLKLYTEYFKDKSINAKKSQL